MPYGDETGVAKGHNAGGGHRAVAAHIKAQHDGAGHSGNSVSGMMKPARTRAQPGAPESVLKTPRRGGHFPHKPID